MGPLVGGDETEIICIWKSNELFVLKRVAKALIKLEGLKDGVKDEKEDDGRNWIALKNSSVEAEWLTSELFGDNNRIGLAVKVFKV